MQLIGMPQFAALPARVPILHMLMAALMMFGRARTVGSCSQDRARTWSPHSGVPSSRAKTPQGCGAVGSPQKPKKAWYSATMGCNFNAIRRCAR
ncbi:uncharacterized protein RCC_03513 [Ramularia collo-cygni]|uniref:Secreted protein n=1 Tax=Ramularia collo-cygni TaxID=112498 RepID=A0A2D3V2B7_9PEZI|nr:uncharacterized protein RCC_03513 [Ramularia collo-cygni]CZT17676.1 uncharacterized protein RCC_03513 [Ramularia collo-cygni]